MVLLFSNSTPNLGSELREEIFLEIQEFFALKFRKPFTILISENSDNSGPRLFEISIAMSLGDFLKILENV